MRVEAAVKIVPTVTENGDGGINVMLINASFDESGRVLCRIRGKGSFSLIAPDGSLLPVDQIAAGDETLVILPGISAWDYVLLTNIG